MLFCPNRFISLIAVFDHLNYIYFYISKIYLKNRWLLFRVVLCKSTLFVCHAIYFWPNRFAQRLIPILIRVILSSGFKGGGRLPVPSGIRPPADPKGPTFVLFCDFIFWLTDLKIFLKAPIYNNFEGERPPKKKGF